MARIASWVAFVQIAAGSAIMGAMSVNLKTPQEIEMMRIAGRLASEVLDIVTPHVKPGVTTEELDRICHDHIVNVQGAIPANVGYRGFPKTVCTSVNNVICHGIPSEGKVLKDGDIVNIDVTVIKDGWHGDTSRMYFVGTPSVMARRLVETTYEAMWRGIRAVRPGATLGDIGHAIQSYAEGERFSVVREYCGHVGGPPRSQRGHVQQLQHIQVQQVEEHRRRSDVGQRAQGAGHRRPFVQAQQQQAHAQGQQQELQ